MAEDDFQQGRMIRIGGDDFRDIGHVAEAEVIEDFVELIAHVGGGVGPGQWLAGEGELPAHQQHQAKTKEEKGKTAPEILNADDFVIGRKNVAAQKTEFMVTVIVMTVVMPMRFLDMCRGAGVACLSVLGGRSSIKFGAVTNRVYHYTFSSQCAKDSPLLFKY